MEELAQLSHDLRRTTLQITDNYEKTIGPSCCSDHGNRIDGMKEFKETLDAKGYNGVVWEQWPGGHEWKVWRRDLTAFVQLIFKK